MAIIATIALTVASCQQNIKANSSNESAVVGAFFQAEHSKRLAALEERSVADAIACFADDAYLMDIGATAQGIENIQEHVEKVLNNMTISLPRNTQEGFEIEKNLAYDFGTTIMTLDFGMPEIEPMEVKSKYVCIWKKNSKGTWKISKLIFNQEEEGFM